MRPRPLFEKGMKVFHIPREMPTEIISAEYVTDESVNDVTEGRSVIYTGWLYRTTITRRRTKESSLRNLPPEATDEEFEAFMDKLKLPHLIPEEIPA